MNRQVFELGVAMAVAVGVLVITGGSGSLPAPPTGASGRGGWAAGGGPAPSAAGARVVTDTVTTPPVRPTVTGERAGVPAKPAGELTAPTGVHAVPGFGRAVVSWRPSPIQGEARSSDYTVVASGGQHVTVAGADTHATVSGLSNGARYFFTVDANTRLGTRVASGPSPLVTTPAGPPSAPLYPDSFAGSRSAELVWQTPAQDGGSPITSYTVTATPGGEQVSVPAARGAIPTVTVHGLTNATRYRFVVYATNRYGESVNSASSNAVAPFGPPGAPTGVHATENDGHLVVSWTPPSNDNGSAISEYRVAAIPGGALAGVDAPQHTLTMTGLTPGMAYAFMVVALNDAATGPASNASNMVVIGGATRAVASDAN